MYIGSVAPIGSHLLTGKEEEAECGTVFHEAYRSVFGAVVWTALTRVDLAVCTQAFQRTARAPLIRDCKRLNVAIRYLKRQTPGLPSIELKHPLKLVAITDAAFKAMPGEPIGSPLRGLAAILCELGKDDAQPSSINHKADLIDVIVRRQRKVVRSTFSAELNGLVDSIEQVLLLQCILRHIYIYIYTYIYIYIVGQFNVRRR